jgi:hypothetical protein
MARSARRRAGGARFWRASPSSASRNNSFLFFQIHAMVVAAIESLKLEGIGEADGVSGRNNDFFAGIPPNLLKSPDSGKDFVFFCFLLFSLAFFYFLLFSLSGARAPFVFLFRALKGVAKVRLGRQSSPVKLDAA